MKQVTPQTQLLHLFRRDLPSGLVRKEETPVKMPALQLSEISVAKRIARLTRRVRFPGRHKLLRTLFPPGRFAGNKSVEEIIDYDNSLMVRCDLGSFIEWCIFFRGYDDYGLAKVLKHLIRKGFQTMDVGANIGAYTLIMARAVGPEGRVAAFEPNPEMYGRLLYNLDLNRLATIVQTHPIALSAQPGIATLYLPTNASRNRGTASLVRYTHTQQPEIKVVVETLDRMAEGWTRCDLIKVDAEGSDFAVLEGSLQVIRKFLPSLIFEFHPELWPEPEKHWNKLCGILAELGYKLYSIGTHRARLRPIVAAPPAERNIVALHGKPPCPLLGRALLTRARASLP